MWRRSSVLKKCKIVLKAQFRDRALVIVIGIPTESHRWSKKDLSHVVTQFGCIFKFPLALVPFKLYVEMTANVWVQKS